MYEGRSSSEIRQAFTDLVIYRHQASPTLFNSSFSTSISSLLIFTTSRFKIHSFAVNPRRKFSRPSKPSRRNTGLSTPSRFTSLPGRTKYNIPRRSRCAWSNGDVTTQWMLLFRKPFERNCKQSPTLPRIVLVKRLHDRRIHQYVCGIVVIELTTVLGSKLHITIQYKYMVRRHSLRYGYTNHPFGSECSNILHSFWAYTPPSTNWFNIILQFSYSSILTI